MKMNKNLNIFFICVIIVLHSGFYFNLFSQINQGKIVYERKTNLLKRFSKIDWMKEWLEEEKELRIKTDEFELYFNDTMSAFLPKEAEKNEWMQWATSLNKVYTNFKANEKITFKDIFGEIFVLKDSIPKRQWKYTGRKRKIAGFECLQLIWQENDSTRIYAWISTALSAPVGPESFVGLPGTVLGLATEDGGIVYFAKSISIGNVPADKFKIPKIKKTQTTQELYEYLKTHHNKSKWDKLTLSLNFGGVN